MSFLLPLLFILPVEASLRMEIATESCAQMFTRLTHQLAPRPWAKKRLQAQAQRSHALERLGRSELQLLLEIENLIRPYYSSSHHFTHRLIAEYRGPRDAFSKRLASTVNWLKTFDQTQPFHVALTQIEEFDWAQSLWRGFRQQEWSLVPLEWRSPKRGLIVACHPELIPSHTLLHAGWPGGGSLLESLKLRQIPIETFLGVATPWPLIVVGRVVEHWLYARSSPALETAVRTSSDFRAYLFAINEIVLGYQLALYQKLIQKAPEFRTRSWDLLALKSAAEIGRFYAPLPTSSRQRMGDLLRDVL